MQDLFTKRIKTLDKNKVGQSIVLLPQQFKQVFKENNGLKLPASYRGFSNIVLDGMGGSNLGARIIRSVFNEVLPCPLYIKAGYELPGFVGKNTLYILSSYSGTTEETLSTMAEAKKKGTKIVALTVQSEKSEIAKFAAKNELPLITFDPKYNPCGQPRLGVGYSIAGILTFFIKAGLINITDKELDNALKIMEKNTRLYTPDVTSAKNPAKKITAYLKGKMPVLVSGDFLEGNMHALRNQINESGKNFASYLIIPEMNHYALEGLAHPAVDHKMLYFIFFDLNLYHPRVKIRNELTKKVVKGDSIKYCVIELRGKTKFEQAMEVLQVGSWISYYFGIINNENPSEVKWVDWFKKKLSEYK